MIGSEPGVAVSYREGLAWVVIERPPANLLDIAVVDALREALAAADEHPDVEAIVLRGGTEGSFCGGADIAALRAGGDPVAFARGAADLFRQFHRSRTPIVAAVGGDALASGFGLVCLADLAVSVPEARLGTNEAALGSWPMLAQVAVVQRLPPKVAMRNVLTGEPFTTEQALHWGVINEVVDRSELDACAERLARAAAGGGTRVKVGRPLFYRLAGMSFDDGLDEASRAFEAMFSEGEK